MQNVTNQKMVWVQRGKWVCLKVDGKFTGVDIAYADMVADGSCAEYWRGQLKDQIAPLKLDPASVLASLDAAIEGSTTFQKKRKANAAIRWVRQAGDAVLFRSSKELFRIPITNVVSPRPQSFFGRPNTAPFGFGAPTPDWMPELQVAGAEQGFDAFAAALDLRVLATGTALVAAKAGKDINEFLKGE